MKIESVRKLSLEDDRVTKTAHRGVASFQVHACENQSVYLFLSEPDGASYSEALTLHRNAAELLVEQLQDAILLLD